MTNEIKSIKDQIIEIFERDGTKADAARFIKSKTSLGKTQSKYWAKKIYDECECVTGVKSKIKNIQGEINIEYNPEELQNFLDDTLNTELGDGLDFSEKYVYNKSEDEYIFLLEKSFGKNVKLEGTTVRSILKNYSNYDGSPDSINQVSNRFSIPRNILIHILKILNITHDSLPVTPEEFEEKSVDEIKNECITGKKFALYQKLQKEEWKSTKDNARKWDEFIIGKYNPFLEALESWTPSSIPSIKTSNNGLLYDDKTFLCVLTDTHIGELTKNSWEGKSFNTQKAIKNILNYISQIESKLSEWKTTPSKCKLVIMGDILNSCVDGMTRKGTKLHNDVVNGDMYKIGLDVIITFVTAMRQLFPNVDISCVNGNHDSFMIGAVYYSASRYFENTDGIVWNISDYWLDSFRVNNCYFIYSHGKDDINHVALPNNVTKFESFVQSLLLKKVHELVDVESKYFISGHLHSYEHIELNDFEKIQVPSSVTADGFAEALGYMTKARQNCFIVGENYIEDTLHFYFQ